MIVVAIIGILAAIAIPSFTYFQYRAKRSEIPTNLSAIRKAEIAYDVEYGTFLAAPANPGSFATTGQMWIPGLPGWTEIGFRPDGKVRANYSIPVGTQTTYEARGEMDLDLNGDIALYTVTETQAITMVSPSSTY